MSKSKKIKKNSEVVVISGAHKGSTGKILAIDAKSERVKIEGVGLRTKNLKPSSNHPQGQTISIPASIHISNVKLAKDSGEN